MKKEGDGIKEKKKCDCCSKDKVLRKDWRCITQSRRLDMQELNVCEICSLLPNNIFIEKYFAEKEGK